MFHLRFLVTATCVSLRRRQLNLHVVLHKAYIYRYRESVNWRVYSFMLNMERKRRDFIL